MSLHQSISIYPSAHSLADELGRWPSWEEYMASLPASFRLYPATSRSGYLQRGLIDDSLPVYYHAMGPFSYEDDEDGWEEVRARGRFRYGKVSKKSKKAAKRAEQEAYMAGQHQRSHFAEANVIQFVD